MKKIIAIILTITLFFTLSLTAFAADSPEATKKITVVLRKADGLKGVLERDVKYTLDGGTEVSVVADEAEFGTFKNWTIYKVQPEVMPTSYSAGDRIIALNASVINLASKTSIATEPTDYEIIKGSLTSKELTVLAHADLIICANYGDTITDPLSQSSTSGTQTDESPQTGDIMALSAVIAILASAAVIFGAKKQLAK